MDDQYLRLLSRFDELDPEIQHTLHQHLSLVAYGAERIPEETPVPVIPLVSWRELDHILDVLTQIYTGERRQPEERAILDVR